MKNTYPTIAIITPVYNMDPGYLDELARCLDAQTYRHYEWIIVDDGTTLPASLKCLETLSLTRKELTIVRHLKNKGLPAARNTGIAHATAAYLFFIDGDDLLEDTAIEKMLLTLLLNPQAAFINSYVQGFGDKQYLWRGGFHEGHLFLRDNRNTSCFLARRSVFDVVLFDESLKKGGEDWDFWLHAASKGFWGLTIPEFLFHYRITDKGNQWSAISSAKKREEISRKLLDKYGPILSKNKFPERSFSDYALQPVHNSLPIIKKKGAAVRTVLFLIPWLEMGGADKFNLDLARGLRDKGWKITIACTAQNLHEWRPLFEKVTKDIFLLPGYSGQHDYYQVLSYLICSRGVKIIFLSHTLYGYHSLPYLRGAFPEVPVIDYLHCEDETWYSGGYPMFSVTYSRLLSRTMTTSRHLRDWCTQRGADSRKTEVVYINIDPVAVRQDPAKRQAIRKELGINDKTALIIYVARLTPQKQPEVLIDALNHLYESEKNFRCVIIGDGPEKEPFLAKLKKSPAARKLHYLESLPNEKVMEYLDAADIFFLPSAFEGIALAIFEAMAKELAIIGAAVGGQDELVTKASGTLVQRLTPSREAKEYGKVLQHFVTHLPETRAMGKAGRQRIEQHFDIRTMIDRIDAILKETIENHIPDPVNTAAESMVLLNRLLSVEKENKLLAEATKSTLKRILAKYPGKTATAKKIFHVIKSNLKKK